jgi:hypothetical protein
MILIEYLAKNINEGFEDAALISLYTERVEKIENASDFINEVVSHADQESQLPEIALPVMDTLPHALEVHAQTLVNIPVSIINIGTKQADNLILSSELDGKVVYTEPLSTIGVNETQNTNIQFTPPEPGEYWLFINLNQGKTIQVEIIQLIVSDLEKTLEEEKTEDTLKTEYLKKFDWKTIGAASMVCFCGLVFFLAGGVGVLLLWMRRR